MRTRGYPGEFREVPWRAIEARFEQWCDRSPELKPMLDIAQSVLASGADAQLAGLLSMTDLVVAARPVPEPPYDEVIVRFQGPWIMIETLTQREKRQNTTPRRRSRCFVLAFHDREIWNPSVAYRGAR
jgi:hypothetical protein